jgi:hypothetical protein
MIIWIVHGGKFIILPFYFSPKWPFPTTYISSNIPFHGFHILSWIQPFVTQHGDPNLEGTKGYVVPCLGNYHPLGK